MASRGFEFLSSIPVTFGSSASVPPTPLFGVTETRAYVPRPLIAYAPTSFFPGTAACAPTPFFGGPPAYAPAPFFGGSAAYMPTPLFGASTMVRPPKPFFPIPAQSCARDVNVSFSTPGTVFPTPPTSFNTPAGNSSSTFVTPATSVPFGTSATQSSSASQQSLAFCNFDPSSSTTGATTITIPLSGEATALAQTTTSDAVNMPFSSGPASTTNSAAYPHLTLSSSEAYVTTPAPSVIANIRECDGSMEVACQFVHSLDLMEDIYAERDQLYERVARAEVERDEALIERDEALIERDQAQADRDSLQVQPDEARERGRQMQIQVQQLCAKIDALKVEVQQLHAKIDALKVEHII
ncbi:flocculation protein FLO11-like [Cryptomeria japonica]|uniref:flocculation protein FLO11-like n=1 Tax=Cryptomeria japonica TaxID=3369 RepID=UPI0027D9ECBD|nr:flocculation protein FLO11-like [Cryptomeria japonica]